MIKVLRYEVNSFNRGYYIEKVNAPLLKAVTILGNRYPEPTIEGVLHPNSKRLVGIWKKYLLFEGNSRLRALISAIFRIVINKIEHSPNWRDRFSWFIEELMNSGWKLRSYNHPVNDWKEPKPYGHRIEV